MHEPIRKSLTKPILFYGCERGLFIFLIGSLCYLILMGLGRISSFIECVLMILLVVAIPATVIGLRALAKMDPQYLAIYLRSNRYPKKIRATSTPFCERGQNFSGSNGFGWGG